jgi:SAM-dependent methyltransferase
MNLFNPQDLDIDSLVTKKNGRYILNENRIRLMQGSLLDCPLEKKSYDFIYSNAVLEHMDSIETNLQKLRTILKDDGVMYHSIDLREHHTNLRTVPDKDTSIEFLKHSKDEWERMYPPGSEFYINRFRASDFQRYFKDSGFKIVDFITTRKMKIDETKYSKIHSEFHKYSIDDLKTTGINMVLKKA